MKVNVAQMRARIAAPTPDIRLYLLHGPDEAGAQALGQQLAQALGPEVEKIDFESKALRESPGALADEAASLSLFGERRLIRVRGADDATVEAVTLLLNAEQAINPVVAFGPGLRTSSKLVKLAIAAPAALALACYPPEGQDAVRLASTLAQEQGLRLTGDVPQRLASAAGGDRAVLAREIEKLALFLDAAPDRPRDADSTTLEAIGADLDESELFEVIEAAIDGRVATIGTALRRLREAGGSGIPLLRQLARRLMTLAELRAQADSGIPVDQLVERIFFRERAATARALKRWNAPQLARAIERVRSAERALMQTANAGDVIAEAECAALTRAAARMRG